MTTHDHNGHEHDHNGQDHSGASLAVNEMATACVKFVDSLSADQKRKRSITSTMANVSSGTTHR